MDFENLHKDGLQVISKILVQYRQDALGFRNFFYKLPQSHYKHQDYPQGWYLKLVLKVLRKKSARGTEWSLVTSFLRTMVKGHKPSSSTCDLVSRTAMKI